MHKAKVGLNYYEKIIGYHGNCNHLVRVVQGDIVNMKNHPVCVRVCVCVVCVCVVFVRVCLSLCIRQ